MECVSWIEKPDAVPIALNAQQDSNSGSLGVFSQVLNISQFDDAVTTSFGFIFRIGADSVPLGDTTDKHGFNRIFALQNDSFPISTIATKANQEHANGCSGWAKAVISGVLAGELCNLPIAGAPGGTIIPPGCFSPRCRGVPDRWLARISPVDLRRLLSANRARDEDCH
jgi:hypothetical protein